VVHMKGNTILDPGRPRRRMRYGLLLLALVSAGRSGATGPGMAPPPGARPISAPEGVPRRQAISAAAAGLRYPRLNGMSVSPDGRRLALRVDAGPERRSDELWCTDLGKQGTPQEVAEGLLTDYSWSGDSEHMVVVHWTGSASSLRIIDLSRRDRGKEVYRSAKLVRYARQCPDAPRWVAVLLSEVDEASPRPSPRFRLAVTDLDHGVEAASCTMHYAPSNAGWSGPKPQVVFPFRDHGEERRIGTIAVSADGARLGTMGTARPVFSVYPDTSGRRVYYCHPATSEATMADEEGLSVIDMRTKAEKVLVPALRYKQLAISPDGNRVAYVGPLRQLHVVQAASGEDRIIAGECDALVRGGTWSAGDRIVFRSGKRIDSIAPDGSDRRPVADLESLAQRVGAEGYIGDGP
jgi:dipeptidyl aminopeptidase/acylaminoacyl peptidase